MQKTLRNLGVFSTALLSIFFINAVYVSDVSVQKNTHETYNIKALKIPNGITFCWRKSTSRTF